MFQHVLVPLDESSLSQRQLAHAAAFARAFQAQVTLLRAYNWSERFAMVDSPTIEVARDAGRTEQEKARTFLEGHAAGLREGGLLVETVVVDAPPADAILREASRRPETLIVIGDHDRGWLARLVRGGTLHDVLQHFHVPVLVIREGT